MHERSCAHASAPFRIGRGPAGAHRRDRLDRRSGARSARRRRARSRGPRQCSPRSGRRTGRAADRRRDRATQPAARRAAGRSCSCGRRRGRQRARSAVRRAGGGRRGLRHLSSRNTQFVADAHRVPLATESVDALVIQAVLEHVLDPWRVAAEIHRVLRPGGLVYADTPFLQQVHEGPLRLHALHRERAPLAVPRLRADRVRRGRGRRANSSCGRWVMRRSR